MVAARTAHVTVSDKRAMRTVRRQRRGAEENMVLRSPGKTGSRPRGESRLTWARDSKTIAEGRQDLSPPKGGEEFLWAESRNVAKPGRGKPGQECKIQRMVHNVG